MSTVYLATRRKVHVKVDGRTFEPDNLDQASTRVISKEEADALIAAEPNRACRRCFKA